MYLNKFFGVAFDPVKPRAALHIMEEMGFKFSLEWQTTWSIAESTAPAGSKGFSHR